MHNLYFVLVHKPVNETSRQARDDAITILVNEGFLPSNGYFSCAQADRAVVGGRWSGILQNLMLAKDFFKEASKAIPPKYDLGYSEKTISKAQPELDKLWHSLGGKGSNPYNRDSYKEDGYDDDAQILTETLLNKLKEEYPNTEIFDSLIREEVLPEELNDHACGHWLVTIDYHC